MVWTSCCRRENIFLNGYIKKDGWIAGKLKPEGGSKIPTNNQNDAPKENSPEIDLDDEPPF